MRPFHLFTLIVLLNLSAKSYAQSNGCTYLTLDKMNVIYVGLDNPVTIHSNNLVPEEVYLEMDKGMIEAKGQGHYIIKTSKEGIYNLSIYHKDPKTNRKNIISTQTIRARHIPLPQLTLTGVPLGSNAINASDIKSITGITCIYSNFDFQLNAAVESFDLTIIPASGKRFKLNNQGSSFSPQTIQLLNNCKTGDLVIFSNIIAGEKITGKTFHCNALSYFVQ